MGQTALFGADEFICEYCGGISPTRAVHEINHHALRDKGVCVTQRLAIAHVRSAERDTPERLHRYRARARELGLTDDQIRRGLDCPS